ncbi:MAG: ice-binding family protein [Spirochaetes bacterium]|nr:ice-binding family protein [Spirochaetota bacterium]
MKNFIKACFIAVLFTGFMVGCASPVNNLTAPTVGSASPEDAATGVPLNSLIIATFSKEMTAATINATTFTLTGPSATAIAGTVTLNDLGTTATFSPAGTFAGNTVYTATITTGAQDMLANPLAASFVWSFTTGTTSAVSPASVALGTAGNFVILAKSAVSTTGTTAITGNIGVSPAAQSFLTGFSETLDSTNVFATSSLVTGNLYAADMAVPTPSNLTRAVSDMEIAYTDAEERVTPDFVNMGAGNVSGLTLIPGLYKWGSGVLIATDVTLSGGANDVWIFQIAEDLTVSNGVMVTLSGGARPENIFWQVAGQASLGTTSNFKGIILCKTQIVMRTGAVMNGRALAQTAVTLDANAVTKPAL